jgi:hypothetical protein
MKQGRSRDRPTHQCLYVGAIREAITIPDMNYSKTRKFLIQTDLRGENFGSRGKRLVLSCSRTNKTEASRFDSLFREVWANHRIQKFSLKSVSKDDIERMKKTCNSDDDYTVHLSTGVTPKSFSKATNGRSKNCLRERSLLEKKKQRNKNAADSGNSLTGERSKYHQQIGSANLRRSARIRHN